MHDYVNLMDQSKYVPNYKYEPLFDKVLID